MERSESNLGNILIIAPDINDSIIATAIMMRIIKRPDSSAVFIKKNSLNKLKINEEIKEIYLLGIGTQNCEQKHLYSFLQNYQNQIRFWANNRRFNDEFIATANNGQKLEKIFAENKTSMADILMRVYKPRDIPEQWIMAADAIANHKPDTLNLLAHRFKKAVAAAETIAQYDELDSNLTAETRLALLTELFSEPKEQIDEMIRLSKSIERENSRIILDIAELIPNFGCGLITQDKQLFNRNKIFNYFLGNFRSMAIQYQSTLGNPLTEIRVQKGLQEKLTRIALALERGGLPVKTSKSQLFIPGDWEETRNVIAAQLQCLSKN